MDTMYSVVDLHNICCLVYTTPYSVTLCLSTTQLLIRFDQLHMLGSTHSVYIPHYVHIIAS